MDHNADLLMSLAHDYEYYDLKEKKQNKKNDVKPKIHLFFPQKEY